MLSNSRQCIIYAHDSPSPLIPQKISSWREYNHRLDESGFSRIGFKFSFRFVVIKNNYFCSSALILFVALVQSDCPFLQHANSDLPAHLSAAIGRVAILSSFQSQLQVDNNNDFINRKISGSRGLGEELKTKQIQLTLEISLPLSSARIKFSTLVDSGNGLILHGKYKLLYKRFLITRG